jgi:putative acetyltransferase
LKPIRVTTDMLFRRDDLMGTQIQALLQEHLDDMHSQSPPESVHALDVSRLRGPDIHFWSLWSQDGSLLGCGALKWLDAGHGEIKSMRTVHAQRGKGLGSAMLAHLLEQARALGLRRLSLETGTQPGFASARRLYERHGFVECPPFADYVLDPNSVFMTLVLDGQARGEGT